MDNYYRLFSHRSSFGHDKSHSKSIYQHKNSPGTCKHIVHRHIGVNDYIGSIFGLWVSF